mmetsp:Transcript_17417/g.35925  ORF Transcript_17417/g.35925 Transcript_17417/m.35925 type:complete len:223 (-) Transcript_17417:146-814(-)
MVMDLESVLLLHFIVIGCLLFAHAFKALETTRKLLAHLQTIFAKGDVASPKGLDVSTEFHNLLTSLIRTILVAKDFVDFVDFVQAHPFRQDIVGDKSFLFIGQDHFGMEVSDFVRNVLGEFVGTNSKTHDLLDTSLTISSGSIGLVGVGLALGALFHLFFDLEPTIHVFGFFCLFGSAEAFDLQISNSVADKDRCNCKCDGRDAMNHCGLSLVMEEGNCAIS